MFASFFKSSTTDGQTPDVKKTDAAKENKETVIPSAQHWKNLRTRIAQFDKQDLKASDEKDEECYKKLRETFLFGLEKGEASESKWLPGKKSISDEVTAYNKQAFGADQIIPIAGAKSLAFVHIYLAHYKDSQHVKIDTILPDVALSRFTNKKKAEYREKATRLEAAIKLFSEKNPELAKLAAAVTSQLMPVATTAQTATATTVEPTKSPKSASRTEVEEPESPVSMHEVEPERAPSPMIR